MTDLIADRSEVVDTSAKRRRTTYLQHPQISFLKYSVLSVLFIAAFLLVDGSSSAVKTWEGAPPCYLPAGLSMALLLYGGRRYQPVVFCASLIAAVVNYGRPVFSWCGLPGAIAIYLGYVIGASLLQSRWPIDLKLKSLKDVGRYVLVSGGAAVVSAGFGVLTLLGDSRIRGEDALRVAVEWWSSDALAVFAFAPLLLLYVIPVVDGWLNSGATAGLETSETRRASGTLELIAQAAVSVLAICLIFWYRPAIPYQPLYLLFVPVIWSAVRRGVRGTVATTFGISVLMTCAAWGTHQQKGSFPRLQLAMLALTLTGLFLGAVVSDRNWAEHAIRASETRYRLLFERNLAGVFRTSLSGSILECNRAAANIFGYESPDEVLALSASDLYFVKADRDDFLKRILSGRAITNYEMKIRRKSGTPAYVLMNVSLVEEASGSGQMLEGTLFDITKRKIAEEQVQSLAFYDALTGLPNRTLLHDRLSQALASARRQNHKVALLFIDLDRFKIINDSLGHSVGDLLLKEAAARINRCAREQDTVARLGGDEFIVVLTNVKEIPDVAVSAKRFMDTLATEFVIQGRSLTVGTSLGISIFPEHGADSETLIKSADAAMYAAKESGRNTFRFFTSNMNAQAVERLALENGLRLALARSELFIEYQPQMSVASGTITGVEALLRWRHPELGLVPPSTFIPIAENTGLIVPIGEWVLRTACCQLRRWQDQGLNPPAVAVNVSAVQFRFEGFPGMIRHLLRETGVEPHTLELELTESLLLPNADLRSSILQQLIGMGLRLAIDDFGTGYSSLSYLKRFPASRLKIDRSFIGDVDVNPDDAAITTAIISMAKSLNLEVVAEGVETEAQMAFLRALGCDAIQGYYFSKPLSAEDLACMLRGASWATPRGSTRSHS